MGVMNRRQDLFVQDKFQHKLVPRLVITLDVIARFRMW